MVQAAGSSKNWLNVSIIAPKSNVGSENVYKVGEGIASFQVRAHIARLSSSLKLQDWNACLA
jgi:hypothetical protein